MRFNRRCHALLIPLLALAAGCVPPAAWLPDSSGVVFTDNTGASARIVHLDVKTGKSTVIAEEVDTGTLLPAVRPDGKQVAVARIVEREGKPYVCRVSFHGLDGKPGGTSRAFEFGKGSKGSDREPVRLNSAAYWSPDGKKVVVGTFDCGTLAYDVAKDDFTWAENALAVWQVQPVRPDSKGYLAFVRSRDDSRRLAVVDWDGKSAPIEGISDPPEAVELRWDRDRLIFRHVGGYYLIDPAAARATHTKEKLAVPLGEGESVSIHTFAGGKTSLCVFEWSEKADSVVATRAHRIELLSPGKKPLVVAGKTRGTPTAPVMSPDRSLVAVLCGGKLRVMNAEGKTVAAAAER